MKTMLLIALAAVVFSQNSMADFKLSKSKKAIVCYAEDNQELILNAQRTMIKYSVEGESEGPKKITKVNSDNYSFVIYKTSDITFTLSDKKDTFKYDGDSQAQKMKCEEKSK